MKIAKTLPKNNDDGFYRAMHFSAKLGIGYWDCMISVCLSVCLWRWWIRITYVGNLGN